MKRIQRNIFINYIYTGIKCMDMTSSIWVLYLAYRGMNLAEIGLLEGIFHLTSMLFEIPTGAIADLLGRKKTIVLSRISALIATLLMISANGFWGFAISFIFSAVSFNLSSGSEEALVYDSLKQLGKEEQYVKVNGRLNFIIEVTQGIGAFLGALLAERSYLLSYSIAIIFTIVALLLALGFEEALIYEKEEKVSFRVHFKLTMQLIKANMELAFLLVYYPIILAISAIIYFYGQQYFAEQGVSKVGIAIIFLLNSVLAGGGALASNYLVKKLRHHTTTIVALLIAVCMVGFYWSEQWFSILLFCFIGGLTAVLQPISSGAMNKLIPSKQRATLISVQSMAFSIMMILFFPLSGVIGDLVGLKVTFVLLGLVLVICVGIGYKISKYFLSYKGDKTYVRI
ncbi:MFS transporter [Cellulosilyticum sp. ST5]|uniref:MFS transporter n=1 Tax=Cellulosilyticum sp. ST5 TaxID=3055805 RepID=UPI0039777B73